MRKLFSPDMSVFEFITISFVCISIGEGHSLWFFALIVPIILFNSWVWEKVK